MGWSVHSTCYLRQQATTERSISEPVTQQLDRNVVPPATGRLRVVRLPVDGQHPARAGSGLDTKRSAFNARLPVDTCLQTAPAAVSRIAQPGASLPCLSSASQWGFGRLDPIRSPAPASVRRARQQQQLVLRFGPIYARSTTPFCSVRTTVPICQVTTHLRRRSGKDLNTNIGYQ